MIRNDSKGSVFQTRLSSIQNRAYSPLLRSLDFRRKGNSYFRQSGDLVWLIDVQKSQWNDSQSAEFTSNCGIFVPGFFTLYTGTAEPQVPKLHQCCIWARVGALSESKLDQWWCMRADDPIDQVDSKIAAELDEVVEHRLLPFLQRFDTRHDVMTYLQNPRPLGERGVWPITPLAQLTHLAIICHMEGDKEASCAAFDRAERLPLQADWLEDVMTLRRRTNCLSTG